MRKWSLHKVPAGKRPRIKKDIYSNSIGKYIIDRFSFGKLGRFSFLGLALFAVALSLALHDYYKNYVYVVVFNDQEVGIVKSEKEVERFIAHLTDSCSNLYGMTIEPSAKVLLIKEFRPGVKPAPCEVQATIRQQLSFKTEAYLITVDGEPFVAVRSEKDLDLILNKLKSVYSSNGYGSRIITTQINQELSVKPGTADPELILEPAEVVALLTGIDPLTERQPAFLSSTADLIAQGNSHAPGYYDLPFSIFYLSGEIDEKTELPVISEQKVSVITVEEAVVREAIPFEVEYIYDQELWVVQKEITVEGAEGLIEVIYHITRENGVEVDRMKIRDTIITEPVNQIETIGTAKVPAVGTGRFIWPVEGGGEITPGRGFSSWHTGIDIHADTGTNILAADNGVVWFSGYGGSQGNYLILYHGSFWTLYLHNSQNLVKEGDAVEQGDIIAKAGSTGRSSGPHLHFEVRLDDGTGEWLGYYQHTPIDPLQFFTP